MKGRPQLLLAALLFTSVASAACTKTEGTSSGTTSTTGTAATTTPSGSSATAASAAPDASPVAADTTTGTAPTGGADATAPTTSATGAAGTKASATAAASAAPAECGTKPLPDCPLQAWMKANMNPAIAANDLPALQTALNKAAGFAPAGYPNWASIAKDGAKASDMTAAKAACRTCHDQYKDKFKKDNAVRARKI